MFPDYPKAKAFIEKRDYKTLFSERTAAMGLFAEVPQKPMHEGHRFALIRENGEFDEMKFEKLRVERTISEKELENWSDDEIRSHYRSMGQEFAVRQQEVTFQQLHEAIEGVGNEVAIAGHPTPASIIEVYEKMWLDFEPDGTPVRLTLACSPDARPAFAKAFKELEETPEWRSRFEEVLARKRREWREREAARKLVG